MNRTDANDVQSAASQSGMDQKRKGEDGSSGISQKDERNSSQRTKEQHPEAPKGPVLGMQDERGGVWILTVHLARVWVLILLVTEGSVNVSVAWFDSARKAQKAIVRRLIVVCGSAALTRGLQHRGSKTLCYLPTLKDNISFLPAATI